MSASPTRGRFITFEGGEGAGKTTQIGHLARRLALRGAAVVSTREPGGTPHAEKLRSLLLSGAAAPLGPLGEAILFTAARIDHIDTLIEPSLARGDFVLCDRFMDSTRAYQGALGKVDARMIALLERAAVGAGRPDLTFVLDVPPAQGLARAAKRRGSGAVDRFESEDAGFHVGLREAFLAIAAAEPSRCVVIDATGAPEEIGETIWRVAAERFFPGEAERT